MKLQIVEYAQSNYGSDVYHVSEVEDGISLIDLIKLIDEYHDSNSHSAIWLFEKREDIDTSWTRPAYTIDIPWDSPRNKNNISDYLLDLPVCCHLAVGSWGANTYFVYSYGKHAKL